MVVINPATNSVINSINVGLSPIGIAFNPSGTLAYVTAPGTFVENVINVATNSVIDTIYSTIWGQPELIAFAPTGIGWTGSNFGNRISRLYNNPFTPLFAIPTSNNALSLTINALSASTLSFTANGLTYQLGTGTNSIYGNWIIYGFGQDATTWMAGVSGLTGTTTLTLSNTLKINSQPVANQLTPSNTAVTTPGQTTTFNVLITGGTGPFTVNLVLQGSGVVNTLSNQNAGTLTFGAVAMQSGTNIYNVIVTDTGTTTPYIFNSVSNTISIPSLTFNSLTISNPTISAGQTQTLTAYVYNGLQSYTYSIYVYNAVNSLVTSQSLSNSLTFNAFTFTQNPSWGTGKFTVNVVIADSNTPTNTVLIENSIYSYNAVFVLTFNSLTISNPIIDSGQTQTITAYLYNGLPPYTYTILVYNPVGLVTSQSVSNALTFNSFVFTQSSAWGAGPFAVNLIVRDSNTPTNTVLIENSYLYIHKTKPHTGSL